MSVISLNLVDPLPRPQPPSSLEHSRGSLNCRPSCSTNILAPHLRHSNSAVVTLGRTSVALRTRPSTETNVSRCFALSLRMSMRESRGRLRTRKWTYGLVSAWETILRMASSAACMDSPGRLSV